ncbi:MAG: DNA polymerase, partial [Patescibacteria group bacterium]
MPEKKTLLIIDANSLIHRAYHALPPLSTAKGEMVNAVYGFFLVFFKVLKEFKPDYIAAAFDTPGPTEREKKFAAYKAKRAKAPDELYAQIPLVKEALAELGIPTYEKQGFEADDCIGTVAKLAGQRQVHPPMEIIIVSGDQDAFQLINEKTRVYTMRKGIQDTVLYDEKAVEKKFGGLKPAQIIDYKALRGDPSDNIPGVTGIGEKTAIELLNMFDSLEVLYAALESGEAEKKIKPRILQLLKDYKDQAFLSQQLATIEKNTPIDFRLPDLEWQEDFSKITEVLERFGFQSLLGRLDRKKVQVREKGQLVIVEGQNARDMTLEKIEQLYAEQVFSEEIYKLEKQLVPILRTMEEIGIKIDRPYFGKLSREMEGALNVLKEKIHEHAGKEFNINSTQQLSEVLFGDLALPVKGLKKTPKGVISTASPELEKLRESHPVVEE